MQEGVHGVRHVPTPTTNPSLPCTLLVDAPDDVQSATQDARLVGESATCEQGATAMAATTGGCIICCMSEPGHLLRHPSSVHTSWSTPAEASVNCPHLLVHTA